MEVFQKGKILKKRTLDGRPYYLPGGEVGILMLHGFTGTPQCMRYPAKILNQAGFSVLVPVLEGHGTHYKEMEKSTWKDWYQSAERAFQELKSHCRQVMVVGLSMGGLLASHLAYQHPKSIHAIALLATPFFLDSFLIKKVFPSIWKTPLRWIYRYQPKLTYSIFEPHAKRRYGAYRKIPVASVANLLKLQKKVRQELKNISQPALLIHAEKDQTVPYANMDFARIALASQNVKTVTLKKSNHIITVDYEKDVVAKALVKFFKKF